MSLTRRPPSVSLFVTCLVDQVRPSVGVATVELLRRLGCNVGFDTRQTCCGQPAFTTGHWHDARAVAQYAIGALESTANDWIVVPSGSCCAMFHHYEQLFAEDTTWLHRARSVIERTRELSVFLVDVLERHDVGARFGGTITWHDACHGLRDLGIREQPRQLLQNVAGAQFVEIDKCDACCGFGGVFSVNYPGISTAMADVKLDAIEAAGIDTVVSGDVGCIVQLETRAQCRRSAVKSMHLAEVLANTVGA